MLHNAHTEAIYTFDLPKYYRRLMCVSMTFDARLLYVY